MSNACSHATSQISGTPLSPQKRKGNIERNSRLQTNGCQKPFEKRQSLTINQRAAAEKMIFQTSSSQIQVHSVHTSVTEIPEFG